MWGGTVGNQAKRQTEKSRGKRTERAACLEKCSCSWRPRELPSVPGLGRPSQETSSHDSMQPPYAPGACTRRTGMAESDMGWTGLVWSVEAVSWADLKCCSFISMTKQPKNSWAFIGISAESGIHRTFTVALVTGYWLNNKKTISVS